MILKINSTMSAAFWVNIIFALIMAAAIHLLCKQLKIEIKSFFIIAAALSCPLLLGLSRELYIEFSLTAIVAMQLVVWFKTDDFSHPGYNFLFGTPCSKTTILPTMAVPCVLEMS